MDPITILQTVGAACELAHLCIRASQRIYEFAGELRTVDSTLARIEDEVSDLNRISRVVEAVLKDGAVVRASKTMSGGEIIAGASYSVDRCRKVLERLETSLAAIVGDANDTSKMKALRQAVRLKRQQKPLNDWLTQLDKSKQSLNVVITTLSVFMVVSSPQYKRSGVERDIAPLAEKLETALEINEGADDARLRRTAASVLARAKSPPPNRLSRSTTLLDDPAGDDNLAGDDHNMSDTSVPVQKWMDLLEASSKPSISTTRRGSLSRRTPSTSSYGNEPKLDNTPLTEPTNEKFEITVVKRCIEKGNGNFQSGNYEQAAAQLEEALRTADELTRTARTFLERDLIKVRLNIAAIYAKQERYPDVAEEHLLHAIMDINDDKRVADDDMQQQLYTAYHTLARVYVLEGKYDEAQTYCEDAVNGQMSVFGEKSKQYYESLQMLIQIYHAQGKSVRAQIFMDDLPPEMQERTRRLVAAGAMPVVAGSVSPPLRQNDTFASPMSPHTAAPPPPPKRRHPSVAGHHAEPMVPSPSNGSADRPPPEMHTDSAGASVRDMTVEAVLAQHGFDKDFDPDKALAWAIKEDKQRVVLALITPPGVLMQRKRHHFGSSKQVFKLASVRGSARKDMRDSQPLVMAAKTPGRVMIAKMLLDRGASVAIQDEFNRSLLEVAAMHGQKEIISVLLDHGVTLHSAAGTRAYLLAAQHGHNNVLELFLGKGGIKPDATDTDVQFGRTAVNLAAQRGHEHTVAFLISRGANPNIADRGGSTPLMASVRERHEATTLLLLRLFADVNLVNDRGQTALIVAAEQGQVAAARAILDEHAVKVDVKDNNGWTALICACNRRQLDVARLILEHGRANVNAQCFRGSRALDHARGCRQLVELLKAHGAQPGSGVARRGTVDETWKGYVFV